jgi:arsenate reductase
MAEGMLRAWGGDAFEAYSGGTESSTVKPEAIAAMAELGIDFSGQACKTIDRYLGQSWYALIPVCEEACDACPYVPGARRVERWSFDDPGAGLSDPEARMSDFRRVRDEIAAAVRDLIARTYV